LQIVQSKYILIKISWLINTNITNNNAFNSHIHSVTSKEIFVAKLIEEAIQPILIDLLFWVKNNIPILIKLRYCKQIILLYLRIELTKYAY
jgi:hypothetical protein